MTQGLTKDISSGNEYGIRLGRSHWVLADSATDLQTPEYEYLPSLTERVSREYTLEILGHVSPGGTRIPFYWNHHPNRAVTLSFRDVFSCLTTHVLTVPHWRML